jgi:hypothetical protein
MTGSLDRTIEEALVSLIDIESGSATQCVPNLLGAGEAQAVCPRIVVTCERQPSPDFARTPTEIYGVYPVRTVVTCMVHATSDESTDDLAEMVSAVDAILIYNGNLAQALTGGELKVYGVVPGGARQERTRDRLIRHREILIWARLQPVTSEAILTEDGEVILTEDGQPIFTE